MQKYTASFIKNLRATFSKPIDAVSPEVSIATTSGSGLAIGRICLEDT